MRMNAFGSNGADTPSASIGSAANGTPKLITRPPTSVVPAFMKSRRSGDIDVPIGVDRVGLYWARGRAVHHLAGPDIDLAAVAVARHGRARQVPLCGQRAPHMRTRIIERVERAADVRQRHLTAGDVNGLEVVGSDHGDVRTLVFRH